MAVDRTELARVVDVRIADLWAELFEIPRRPVGPRAHRLVPAHRLRPGLLRRAAGDRARAPVPRGRAARRGRGVTQPAGGIDRRRVLAALIEEERRRHLARGVPVLDEGTRCAGRGGRGARGAPEPRFLERAAARLRAESAGRRLTFCRLVRGSHGGAYVYDPEGTDEPPAWWSLEAAMRARRCGRTSRCGRRPGHASGRRGARPGGRGRHPGAPARARGRPAGRGHPPAHRA